MNILYINANPRHRLSHAAGYATHMTKTIKGFEAAGHRVLKFLGGESQGVEQTKQTYRRISSLLPANVSKMLRDLYELSYDRSLFHRWLPLARKEKVDFVYERMNQLHSCGLRLARRLRVPFVIEINDPLRETVTVDLKGFMKRYAVHLEDKLVRESDFVVLGSEELKKSYARRGCPADKLLVLYPTADLELFRPGSGDEIKRQLGLQGKVVVGFVAGNIATGWRRPDLLLGAIRSISGKQPDFGALIVGEGALQQSGLRPTSGLPEGAMVFSGKVPHAEVPRLINAMDICVIPGATWYGSPTKLFEYGAMGKAVVAPRLPPILEVIEHGISGLLFMPEDQADLVKQIASLFQSGARRGELGASLRRKIISLYTWEKNTKALIESVARIVSGQISGKSYAH